MRCVFSLLFAAIILHGQLTPVSLFSQPAISPPAVDSRGVTALISSTVAPDGTIGAADLYLLSTFGTPPRRLTALTNAGASSIDLSTDGSKAAYVATSSVTGLDEVHVIDTSSGADTRIAVDSPGCIRPLIFPTFACIRNLHFSPDATRLFYSASPGYSIANTDGSGIRQLAISGANVASSPQRVISRNGLLVFTTNDGVFVVNLDGSGQREIVAAPSGASVFNATISENGALIAFQQRSPGSNPVVANYLVSLDGTDPKFLSSGIAPSLSADASLVLHVAPNNAQAYLQNTDGTGASVRLTNFRHRNPDAVTLSGDGSTAFITAQSGLYVVRPGQPQQTLFAPTAISPSSITSITGRSAPSPGSLFVLFGINFLDDADLTATAVPLPAALGGVSVRVNHRTVPIASVNITRIVAQMPSDEIPGPALFEIVVDDGHTISATASISPTAPELLQPPFHAGTTTPADQTHPAAPDEILEMYGFGLGPVAPSVEAGTPAPSNPPATAISIPVVKMGNQNATITYAGLAPGQIGVYQVNAIVPPGLRSGAQPVSWSAAGQPPSASLTLWIH